MSFSPIEWMKATATGFEENNVFLATLWRNKLFRHEMHCVYSHQPISFIVTITHFTKNRMLLLQQIWLAISINWAETKVHCISWIDEHKMINIPVFVSEICHSKRDVVVVIDSSGSIRDNNPEDQSIDNWIILKGEGERERDREREGGGRTSP